MMSSANKNSVKISVRRELCLLFCFLTFAFTLNIQAQEKTGYSEKTFTLGCLRNAFFNVDINDATAAVKIWGQELQKRIKIKTQFDLKLFEDINELLNYPGRDNLGFIVLNSVDYLKYKSKLTLYPSFIPVFCEEYLIIAKGDNFKDLKSLEGKRLGLIKMDYNPIPFMWLDVFLGKNKFTLKEKYFGSIKEFNNESQLILAVFFDQYDVCIVSKKAFETMVELNPQVGKRLKILAVSPCYLAGLSCLTKNSVKFSYINDLIDGLVKLDSYPEGKQILTVMKTQKVREFVDGDLDSVEALLKEFKEMKNKRK